MGGTPKLRHLPPIPAGSGSRLCKTLKTVWEIDVPAISWSIALSFLMTVPNNKIDNFLKTVLRSEPSLSENKIKAKVRKIKKIVRKYNPFLKSKIQNDYIMKGFINYFRNFLFSDFNENNWHDTLKKAADCLKCTIYLYSVDSKERCQLFSVLEPSESRVDCPTLIILCHSKNIDESSVLPKFNFGLPTKLAEKIRRKGLNKILWKINLTEDEIQEINKSISSGKNFIVSLLQSSNKTIIPTLYEPPYIARKLAEAGLDVDPKFTDENGFSAFHYCMDLEETRFVWLLYNFASNMFHLKDHNVRNPDAKILNTLKQIGQIIEKDVAKAKNKSTMYKKTASQLLRFNQYQREVLEETIRLKETEGNEAFKLNMLFILKKYEEYFHFNSLLCNHTLDLSDELGLFHNFVLHTEYHQNLDVFTSLMFFDQFPHITGYINQTNKDIFTNTLSSIFLSILSNNFFPKNEHKSNERRCDQWPDNFELENNAQRFVAFYYRQCFLSKVVALGRELDCFQGDAQPPTDLLEIIRSSLSNLPEVKDEFLIVRIILYLEAANECYFYENESTRMFTFERTLQIIGEILSDQTMSRTVARVLISSCLPTDLSVQIMKIRHHCIAKYRSSAVEGRINIEKKDHAFLNSIHQELQVIDQVIKTVFLSQKFRVEEFLIENFKINAGYISKNIMPKLDKILSKINTERKKIFLTQKENLYFLLRALFKNAIQKLAILKALTDFKDISEAINYLLKFVATHWEEYSAVFLKMNDNLRDFISSVKLNETIDDIKLQLQNILLDNLKILENIFCNVQIDDSPFDFSYSTLPTILNEIKDFDPFTPKEKIIIKDEISEFVRNSNKMILALLEDCSKNRGPSSEEIFERIIVPENIRSELKKYFSTIGKMNELHKIFSDTKQITNKTLFDFLRSNLDEYGIFSIEEKEKIKDLYEFWRIKSLSYPSKPLRRFLAMYTKNDLEIFYEEDPVIKTLKDRLNTLFEYKDKKPSIEKRILKNFNNARKILESINKNQKIETWYKDLNADILNLELDREENLSVFLKISLPIGVRRKLLKNLNKKHGFLINRIGHMKRLLIFEDATIRSLWQSGIWKNNPDEKRHLKSLLIQRFQTEKRVRASLELLLYDCMLILKCDDLANLWKKTNNMFIGSNMIQLLAHGNPLIEAAGSLLDPTDLASDFIDKIVNLIEDEPVIYLLSVYWQLKNTCKESYLKEFISNTFTFSNACPKWESYLKLLPLRR